MRKIVTHNTMSVRRVVAVAILVFLINFIPPINGILKDGVFPTLVQLCEHLTWGVLEVVTILYGLLKFEDKEGEEDE